ARLGPGAVVCSPGAVPATSGGNRAEGACTRGGGGQADPPRFTRTWRGRTGAHGRISPRQHAASPQSTRAQTPDRPHTELTPNRRCLSRKGALLIGSRHRRDSRDVPASGASVRSIGAPARLASPRSQGSSCRVAGSKAVGSHGSVAH